MMVSLSLSPSLLFASSPAPFARNGSWAGQSFCLARNGLWAIRSFKLHLRVIKAHDSMKSLLHPNAQYTEFIGAGNESGIEVDRIMTSSASFLSKQCDCLI